ncbi:hypothetical protein, partial [Streptomyces rubiginosohelvolus]|uniref:hypothetical protein n=1 Tax=Streptomyces rubiginosohelvolus TaxID=67362 RepID=UPI0035DDDB42
LLPTTERKKLRQLARQEVACLYDTQGLRAHIVEEPSGRPVIRAVRTTAAQARNGFLIAQPFLRA